MRGLGTLLRQAGWWIADYAYAAQWQLIAFCSRARPDDFAHGTRTPIVVLPGVYETWRFMLPLIRELHEAGHPVHVGPALGRNRRSVTESAALVEERITELSAGHPDTECIIVAHSKGGLIGKQLLLGAGSASQIASMVAIATPFSGSRYASLFLNRTVRSLSPRDAVLRALGADASANSRITSVYAAFDPHIPESSELAGARNVQVDTGGHFRVLADPRVRAEVLRAVTVEG